MPHSPTTNSPAWRTASRSTSAPEDSRIEVSAAATTVSIRDSRRPAEALTTERAEWSALLGAIRQGRL